jgi:hypothetical protein
MAELPGKGGRMLCRQHPARAAAGCPARPPPSRARLPGVASRSLASDVAGIRPSCGVRVSCSAYCLCATWPGQLRYRCGVQRCPDRSAAGMIVTSLYVPVRLVGRSFARVAPTLAPADRASLLNLDHGQNEQARSTLPRLRRHRFPGADPAMGRDHTGRPPSFGRQAIPSHHLSTLSARRVFQRPGVPTPPSRSK